MSIFGRGRGWNYDRDESNNMTDSRKRGGIPHSELLDMSRQDVFQTFLDSHEGDERLPAFLKAFEKQIGDVESEESWDDREFRSNTYSLANKLFPASKEKHHIQTNAGYRGPRKVRLETIHYPGELNDVARRFLTPELLERLNEAPDEEQRRIYREAPEKELLDRAKADPDIGERASFLTPDDLGRIISMWKKGDNTVALRSMHRQEKDAKNKPVREELEQWRQQVRAENPGWQGERMAQDLIRAKGSNAWKGNIRRTPQNVLNTALWQNDLDSPQLRDSVIADIGLWTPNNPREPMAENPTASPDILDWLGDSVTQAVERSIAEQTFPHTERLTLWDSRPVKEYYTNADVLINTIQTRWGIQLSADQVRSLRKSADRINRSLREQSRANAIQREENRRQSVISDQKRTINNLLAWNYDAEVPDWLADADQEVKDFWQTRINNERKRGRRHV